MFFYFVEIGKCREESGMTNVNVIRRRYTTKVTQASNIYQSGAFVIFHIDLLKLQTMYDLQK